MIITGGRVLLQIPITVGLWKFKSQRWYEHLFTLLIPLVLLTMLCVDGRDTFYFVISLGAIASFIPQPIELLRQGHRGVVSAQFLWTILGGVAFWSIYSIAIGDWVLSIANPTFLLVVATTLVIYYVLPPAPVSEASAESEVTDG
jgi:uncharacterized protein with PQ loop repeat